MKTTVEVPDELFREVKQYAARNGISMRIVVERGLRMAISEEHAQKKPFRLKTTTTKGQGLVCDDDWQTIRSLAYEGHGG